MKKVKLTNFLYINIILFAFGIIAILIGIILGGTLVLPLLEAVGTGLIAASGVNLLDRYFSVEMPSVPPLPPPPGLGEKVVLAATKRCLTSPDILNSKFSAAKVDIIGVTLNHALEELTKDGGKQIIENLLFHNLQLRLFLVHPASAYLKQRAEEDNDNYEKLVQRQIASVKECEKFFQLLKKRYLIEKGKGRLDTRFTGSLHIKLLDFCPYISVFRINDDKIYWGLYTSGATGLNLPLFLTTTERDPDLYAQLHDHIHGLMEHDSKYPDLIYMTNLGEPVLVEKVLNTVMPIKS
ncbi:MAG: hypothetical protein P4L50_20105 [Anaerolineaceae bacterium]|nr:hypothetical protein [Anaerolineaceae bacterium]